MNVHVIKTEEQYERALLELQSLMEGNVEEGSEEADLIELWALLISDYEDKEQDVLLVDPVEAIKFRMDQSGLVNRDLVPFIGSASKVSEVLNRKRDLSLQMIRALHKGLGIPYDSLMGEKDPELKEEVSLNWLSFPLKEMVERNLFPAAISNLAEAKENAEECIRSFFGTAITSTDSNLCFLRSGASVRSGREMNQYALEVWRKEVLDQAGCQKVDCKFELENLDDKFFEELCRLSIFHNGPQLAKEFLAKVGIRMVYVTHYKKTYLDGAALKLPNGHPVVAITARYDRLDNFWFVLLHELAHVKLHLYRQEAETIFDDLDCEGSTLIEEEADDLAISKLVPDDLEEELQGAESASDLKELARQFQRSPAILAGFKRRMEKNYRIYNALVGHGEVRFLMKECA